MRSSRSTCRGSSGCSLSPRCWLSSCHCWCSCARFFLRYRARAARCARKGAKALSAGSAGTRWSGFLAIGPGDDQILVEPAFQRAVVKRGALGRAQSDQLRKSRIPREEVTAPARVVFLQRIAELRVELRERGLFADPGAVGRIGEEHARARRGAGIENVGLFEFDAVAEARCLEVEAGFFQLLSVAIAGEDREPLLGPAAGERRVAYLVPPPEIESGEALEAEGARVSRRDREGHHRRLDDERPAAAHGVKKGLVRVPTREPNDAGGKVFLQWGFARIPTVAAFVERFAGGVQVESDLRLVEEGLDAHLGGARVHVGPPPAVRAKPVAHSVLDSQSREFEALQRRAYRVDVDANALRLAEPFGPLHRESRCVHIFLSAVRRAGKPHQDTRGEPRLEVGAVTGEDLTLERDAARNDFGFLCSAPAELFGEERFEASRAGGEEGLHAHGGVGMMGWAGLNNGTGA